MSLPFTPIQWTVEPSGSGGHFNHCTGILLKVTYCCHFSIMSLLIIRILEWATDCKNIYFLTLHYENHCVDCVLLSLLEVSAILKAEGGDRKVKTEGPKWKKKSRFDVCKGSMKREDCRQLDSAYDPCWDVVQQGSTQTCFFYLVLVKHLWVLKRTEIMLNTLPGKASFFCLYPVQHKGILAHWQNNCPLPQIRTHSALWF